jgi:hypothetical protein
MESEEAPIVPSNGPPQKSKWYLRVQGDCVEVVKLFNYTRSPQDVNRGQVEGFTKTARMRLLRTIAHINWHALGRSLFVTLTYPDKVGETAYDERSKHRYLFLRYLEKHVGRQVPVLWRVEWKPRKTGYNVGKIFPHIHLLVGGVDYVDHRTIRKWWRSIVHVNGPLCTDVQTVEPDGVAALYTAKYTAKYTSLDNVTYHNRKSTLGRHWGFCRKHLFTFHEISWLREMTDEQAAWFRNLAAQTFRHYDGTLGGGFTLFGEAFRRMADEKCAEMT